MRQILLTGACAIFMMFSLSRTSIAQFELINSLPTIKNQLASDQFAGLRTSGGRKTLPPGGFRPGEIEFRTFDGSQNNLFQPSWGMTHIQLLRYSRPDYADGLSEPAGDGRLSAREISNIIAAQTTDLANRRQMSSMVWQWGQFLDHDIDLTEAADPPEEFHIDIPPGDPVFDPLQTGVMQIMLFRSVYDSSTGTNNTRQQLNDITAWIDGSNVYGSDEETANSLRTFQDGLMATSDGDLLPQDDNGFFLAGDIRANEQQGLTSMHTLFVREHNRIARRIKSENPNFSDQEIYLRARRENIAVMQVITYEEFLPALLGEKALRRYRGYDPNVNPGIANEFSTAAYRVGHTMLNSNLLRLDNDGNVITAGNIALRDAFFSPQGIVDVGIEPYLMGLINQQANEIDNQLVDDVRNFLFGPVGSGGFDLAALNIQRGRDHGLCDFNRMRIDYGLRAHQSIESITSNTAVQDQLMLAYDDINDIDPWVGLLAEDHVRGASVGPTVQKILAQQFEALRDGDRFWYEINFSKRDLKRLRQTRLSDVIKRNTTLTNVQPNVFFVPR